MTTPTNATEYLERFYANQKVSGYYTEVKTHCPCPFCAAPDWMILRILYTQEDMQKDTTCKECGRSAKAVITTHHGGVSFEFVQTGGPDQPEWLTPKMRRL